MFSFVAFPRSVDAVYSILFLNCENLLMLSIWLQPNEYEYCNVTHCWTRLHFSAAIERKQLSDNPEDQFDSALHRKGSAL